MSKRYNVHEIEAKWRRRWEQSEIYRVDLDRAQRPFYNLMEFPYPSGEGLHVGHVYTYCGADAFGRLRRMQGYTVFQPMGFDAFGIHSENYALKMGAHPRQIVPANIRRFREEQLKRLGCQFDWSREVDTTDVDYYRWTQWIFIQLFKAGLAYKAEAPVRWCPRDQTVLANEQVINGRCERCDTLIEQKVMSQWFLRISAYADRLLDFSEVDFPEVSIKRQSAWIGRSEGAEISFPLAEHDGSIAVFTTRPDTIFGASFIVLAPEHPLVAEIASHEQRPALAQYVEQAGRKLERERLAGAEKTGVFTGAYAINPASGQRLPIWVADYVLAGYGSGAIMAVPGHDERDFAFAQALGLPIKRVVAPASDQAGEPLQQAYVAEGVLVASGQFSGLSSQEGARAIVEQLEQQGAGRAMVSYRLRDWLISRQRYWGPPIPIIYCARCGTLAVPEDQLPVVLPHVDNFRPRGTSPLAAVEGFVNTTCHQCGGQAQRETDVSDNFLDSAWYFLRYTSTEQQDRPWDQARLRDWLPVDQYAGGPEHTTMHHLYARFIYKALHDLGHVPGEEPFKRLRLHGMITRGGAKISKSRGNVVTPDTYIARYGTDVFRIYMLFLGPWQEGGDFSDAGIGGVERFARRLWEFIGCEPAQDAESAALSQVAEQRRHGLIARVSQNLEELRFHVAIAALMEELNWLREHGRSLGQPQWRRAAETMALLLAPLAPHLAEELWAQQGKAFSIHQQPWPSWDAAMLDRQSIEIPVQINGKVRARITVSADAERDDVARAALESRQVRQALEGAAPRRVVVVPGRIVNIVV